MRLLPSFLALGLLPIVVGDSAAQSLPAQRRPVVAFDAIDLNGPGVTPEYYKRHYSEGLGTLSFTLRLDAPAPHALSVHYAITGDAVVGRHYEVPAGSQSPIQFSVGQTTRTLSIRLLPVGEYFDERILRVRLLTLNSGAWPDPLADELHLSVRSMTDPPSVEFDKAADSGGVGLRGVTARVVPGSNLTDEVIRVHWRQTNVGDPDAAVEGVDYAWLPAGGSGSVTIDTDAGETSGVVPFEVLGTATDGRVLELSLDHERADRSDENLATFTSHYGLEFSDKGQREIWPAEPADHVPGPAGVLGKGPVPLTHFFDPGAVHPDTGELLNGLVLAPGAAGSGYHRKSFENQVLCDGPLQLYPLRRYLRWSHYVELPSLQSGVSPSRFVRMSLRDRQADENHVVVFDRESPDGGLLGAVVSTSTGDWGVWAVNAWNASSDFGVENESGRTRLWIIYHEEDVADLGHVTARIMYPTWFSIVDGSVDEVGGPDENEGKGLLFYDQYLEMADTMLSGPPGFAWEKRGNWWQPRGRATVIPGGSNVHRFTIDVP